MPDQPQGCPAYRRPAMWRLTAGQSLHHRAWDDDEFVLYNDLSGDTHLLGPVAMAVLLALRQGAADLAGLAARLELDADEAAALGLDALLGELAALYLTEAAPC